MDNQPPDPRVRDSLMPRAGTIGVGAVVLAGAILCLLLATPFAGALTWSVTLAVLFAPLQARFERLIRHNATATALTVLIAVLVVAVPSVLVIDRLVRGAIAGATFLQSRIADGTLQLPPFLRLAEHTFNLPSLMSQAAGWLSRSGASVLRGSIAQLIEAVLTFYFLFYFLRDRQKALAAIRDLLPLDPAETDLLFRRIVDTIYATIYGTLMVAALQGALAGFMFWVLGIAAPLFWGVVMALLSVVPVLGTFVIWIPEAIFLALEGHEVKAAILALWGSLVVGEIDNVVRPILVGNRLRLHTVPVFIAIIGGLILFGMPGFMLGPLIVTTTLALFASLRRRAAAESEHW